MIKNTTLIVLLVAVILGGLVYYFEVKHPPSGTPSADSASASMPAFSLKSSDVASFTVSYPAAANKPVLRVDKKGDSWEIEQPLQTPADTSAVQAVLDSLVYAQITQTEPSTPDRLKAYGLDSPQASLEFSLQNGQKHTIELGDKDFTGGSVYAIVDGAKNVSILSGSVLGDAQKSADDLRDHAILHPGSGQVTAFVLRNASEELAGTKPNTENGDWKLTKPEPAAADGDAVQALLAAVSTAKSTAIVSEKPDNLAKYGLDAPAVTLTETDDKGHSATLAVGKKEGSEYFARETTRPLIFRINDDTYKKLTENFNDLRDKNVLQFDPADMNAVEVHNAHGTIDLHCKQGDDWVIDSPAPQKGKSVVIGNVFDPLRTLRSEQVLDHPPANLTALLSKPAVEATLTDKNGKKITLRISSPSGDFVYAQSSESPALFKLKKEAVDAVNFDVPQLLAN